MVARFNLTHLLPYASLFLLTPTAISQAMPQKSAPSHFKFRWLGSGRTMKRGGVEVSFARDSSENGVQVERFQEDYRTRQAAFAELGRLRRQASKVEQDGYKTDSQGKRVDPRVEPLFAPRDGCDVNSLSAPGTKSRLGHLSGQISILVIFTMLPFAFDVPPFPALNVPTRKT